MMCLLLLPRLLLPLAALGALAAQPPSASCGADVSLLQRAKTSPGSKVELGEDANGTAAGPHGEHDHGESAHGEPSADEASKQAPTVLAGRVTSLDAYPDYTGPLSIKGEVSMKMVDGSLALVWSLSGTEDVCNGTDPENSTALSQQASNGTVLLQHHSKHHACGGLANACGLHIHEGKSCANASEVGGHFYASEMEEDPWAKHVYISSAGGSIGSSSLDIGKGISDVIDHAFVVHDHTGARVACGLIAVAEPSPEKSAAAGIAGIAPLFLASMLLLWLQLD